MPTNDQASPKFVKGQKIVCVEGLIFHLTIGKEYVLLCDEWQEGGRAHARVSDDFGFPVTVWASRFRPAEQAEQAGAAKTIREQQVENILTAGIGCWMPPIEFLEWLSRDGNVPEWKWLNEWAKEYLPRFREFQKYIAALRTEVKIVADYVAEMGPRENDLTPAQCLVMAMESMTKGSLEARRELAALRTRLEQAEQAGVGCPIHGSQFCTCKTPKPEAEQIKQVSNALQRLMFHEKDCAVHSPKLRPCSCGLETRLRNEIAALQKELKLWKPLAREEAEQALAEAEGVPISDEEINAIVAKVTDPAYLPTEPECVQLAAKVSQLQIQLTASEAARQQAERERDEARRIDKRAAEWKRIINTVGDIIGVDADDQICKRVQTMKSLYVELESSHTRQADLLIARGKEITALQAEVTELKRERDNWTDTAAQFSSNSDYYRGLVVEIGKLFGQEACTSDDGSIQDSVLCAKVPELVTELKEKLGKAVGFANANADLANRLSDQLAAEKKKVEELKEVVRQRNSLCIAVRNAVNRYHATKRQAELDELESLTGKLQTEEITFNQSELRACLEDALRVIEKGIEVRIGDQWPVLQRMLPACKERIKAALASQPTPAPSAKSERFDPMADAELSPEENAQLDEMLKSGGARAKIEPRLAPDYVAEPCQRCAELEKRPTMQMIVDAVQGELSEVGADAKTRELLNKCAVNIIEEIKAAQQLEERTPPNAVLLEMVRKSKSQPVPAEPGGESQ